MLTPLRFWNQFGGHGGLPPCYEDRACVPPGLRLFMYLVSKRYESIDWQEVGASAINKLRLINWIQPVYYLCISLSIPAPVPGSPRGEMPPSVLS